MNIGIIILAVVLIIIIVLIKNKEEENNSTEENINNEESVEMKTIFYAEIEKGEKAYKLINIFNQFDLMFIKSLFQSEQIPFFVEAEHMSKIRPGMTIGSFGTASIYIL